MQEMDREENIHDKPMTSTEKPVHSKQQEVNAFFALQFQHDEKFKAAQKSGPFTNANSTADGSKADPKAKHTTKPKGKAEPKPATKKAAAAKKRKWTETKCKQHVHCGTEKYVMRNFEFAIQPVVP